MCVFVCERERERERERGEFHSIQSPIRLLLKRQNREVYYFFCVEREKVENEKERNGKQRGVIFFLC